MTWIDLINNEDQFNLNIKNDRDARVLKEIEGEGLQKVVGENGTHNCATMIHYYKRNLYNAAHIPAAS